jgi:parallel beta-helix repeat protein
MIYVYNGTYKESVNVDRRLTLQGKGADVVNVTGVTSGHVFWVTADYVNISGFSLSEANDYTNKEAGIYLDSADHCNIFNNNVLKNWIGIRLRFSKNNILMNNTANSNQYGIYLGSSSNNTLMNNAVNSGQYSMLPEQTDGISLYSSSNNTLTNNTANSNWYCGIRLSSSSNNTLTNNTANLNLYDIYLDSSSNNTLMNNTLKSTMDVIVYPSPYGLYRYYGYYCYYSYSISLYSSSDNNFIYNNYFNSGINALDSRNNIWNTTPAPGTNIIGGPYLGGNYWSDYDGKDTDGDGLGDTLLPYRGDYHPLVRDDPSPDTTPPVITNITNSTPASDSITIIWDTDENSNSLVKYGTVQSNYTDAVLDTVMVSTHKITLSGLMPDSVYYFAVNSTDASNNSARSEELKFNTAAAVSI